MFGVVLKANWSEDPVTVNLTDTADNFPDGMPLDPDAVADTWAKARIVSVRDFRVRSTRTGRLREAHVVKEVQP